MMTKNRSKDTVWEKLTKKFSQVSLSLACSTLLFFALQGELHAQNISGVGAFEQKIETNKPLTKKEFFAKVQADLGEEQRNQINNQVDMKDFWVQYKENTQSYHAIMQKILDILIQRNTLSPLPIHPIDSSSDQEQKDFSKFLERNALMIDRQIVPEGVHDIQTDYRHLFTQGDTLSVNGTPALPNIYTRQYRTYQQGIESLLADPLIRQRLDSMVGDGREKIKQHGNVLSDREVLLVTAYLLYAHNNVSTPGVYASSRDDFVALFDKKTMDCDIYNFRFLLIYSYLCQSLDRPGGSIVLVDGYLDDDVFTVGKKINHALLMIWLGERRYAFDPYNL